MIENEGFRKVNEPKATRSELSHSEDTAGHNEHFPMIAKTLAELEDVLAEELIALGADNVELGTRMVSFTGDKALMYKVNVHCRTALRILKPFYTFKAESADEVYEAVKQFNWDDYLSLDTTFSIDAVVFSHIFTHSKFVAYRVKDAIADWFNEKYEKRPSVSVSNPDIVLHIHVAHNKCTLSLDSSGESLHKRGYRVAQGDAPLNEVLAAGMILKSGWRGECDFIDPMCGSGTLLIEAAMIALGIPPGIHRPHFAFEKWKDFDSELFSTIYNDDSGAREFNHRIMGFDISPKAIAIAEKNVKNAGLKKYIDLEVKPFRQFAEAPAPEGILMTNPPYGERLKVEDLDELYSMIGERLKHVFPGYRAYVLSYRKESFDAIGLKHSTRYFLYNGALECEMREYEIFSGKRDDRPVKGAPRSRGRSDGYDAHSERNSREGYRRSQRANETGEEKSRDEYRPKRSDDDRNRDKPFKSDRPFKPRRSSSNPDKPFRSDTPFKSRERSAPRGEGRREVRSGDPGDKPFKSRERFSREEGRGGRSDKPGAKSFKSDKPFSGKKFSDKDAKPRDFRKK
ncbi:23S rRNA G2445 N2-methylase RlmL [Proteiniphilum saccharofermentans]|uniref:23S rRNA G2445 N2-methylase RlmL n=2 Tax=Proteiniphilum saccharofermentans TaxID=1642647 RepID=A0A1R3T2M4_9BACT|nr:23S rRNA G2445 N2-methylase RlmL [Proteiniphilum saccharofermentans]